MLIYSKIYFLEARKQMVRHRSQFNQSSRGKGFIEKRGIKGEWGYMGEG